jgi:hypothetical protein
MGPEPYKARADNTDLAILLSESSAISNGIHPPIMRLIAENIVLVCG